MKKRWGLIVLVAGISFFSGGWLLRGASAKSNGIAGPELLGRVLQFVGEYYVDEIPQDSVYHMAAAGVLDQLNDPYSGLEEGEDYRQLTEVISGNYGGLGMQIDVRDGWITIVAPLPETPASRAGIEAGDQIIEVDGKSTQGLTQEAAVKTLRGTPGSKVALKVHRPGMTTPLPFALTREIIHNRSVQPGTMLENGVGYVSLVTVADSSGPELSREINALRAKGMKSLILDLRGNPGGSLDQGAAVSDLFLDPGAKIVSTHGRFPEMNKEFTDHAPQKYGDLPVVVLVNEFSASAAEIIAGALQDNDRAVVVGTPTFGKGLVQSFWTLGQGAGLKLTTGRWYTPSGRTIQRKAKSQEEQYRQAALQASGKDTAAKPLPTFKTISGRLVKGGGGIVPDRIVRSDTLTEGEKTFAKAIGTNVTAYRDALTATALDVKEKKLVTSESFKVTPAIRQGLVDRLKAKGITLTAEDVTAGSTLIDDQLSYEIARYVFGREGELRRRDSDDPQVHAALELLRKATTPKSLMAEVAGQ
jgi:carboxyl-terminal processing protease